jgi:hypothetical protein
MSVRRPSWKQASRRRVAVRQAAAGRARQQEAHRALCFLDAYARSAALASASSGPNLVDDREPIVARAHSNRRESALGENQHVYWSQAASLTQYGNQSKD